MTKRIGMLLRLLLGLALLVFLALRVDWSEMLGYLVEADLSFYGLCLALTAGYIWLQGLLLSLVLHSCGYQVPVGAMVKHLAISNFFGVFLPGGSGPDVVLFLRLKAHTQSKISPFSAVVFVRLAGLAMVILLAFLMSALGATPLPQATWLLGLVSGGTVGAYLLFTSRRFGRFSGWCFGFLKKHRWTNSLYRAVSALVEVGQNRILLLKLLPGLLLVAVLRAVMDALLCRALGFDLPWHYFLVFSSMVTLATVLPLTVAGIGVREGVYMALLGAAGVPSEAALIISELSFSLIIWVCLAGGILYLLQRGSWSAPPSGGEG